MQIDLQIDCEQTGVQNWVHIVIPLDDWDDIVIPLDEKFVPPMG